MLQDLLKHLDAFLLVFLRITAFLFSAPLFNSRTVPTVARLGLAFFLAIILFYPLYSFLKIPGFSPLRFGVYAIKEFLTGLAMGFSVSMIFSAFQLAGTIYGYQMGFGIISVLDPEAGVSVSLTGQLKFLLGVFLFLETNCHHYLLMALFNSFKLISLGGAKFTGGLTKEIVSIFGGMFLIAIQIALPIIAVLLIIDISLGIIGRTIPQLNIFVIGFPLKIAIAFLTLMFILPALKTFMEGVLGGLIRNLGEVIVHLK